MTRADKRLRDYTKPDDIMLEQAQTMRNLFEIDKTAFTAMYTNLDDPFSDNWQSDIDAAQALPTSDEEIMELESKTEDVEIQMELARAQYQKMASYVKLLFPSSKAKQGVFGLSKYVKVYQSQTKMHDLMQLAYRKSNSIEFKSDLIALGFVQSEIDALNTIATGLYNANELQEDFKQAIKLHTEERVAAYNKVWGSMKLASSASKQVFYDNYTKIQQYLLYPEGEGGLPGKVQGLSYDYPGNKVYWETAPKAMGYQLERMLDGETNWTVKYEGPAKEYIDILGPGLCHYRCRGHNDDGYGDWSNILDVHKL
jgi:hypothetical protein